MYKKEEIKTLQKKLLKIYTEYAKEVEKQTKIDKSHLESSFNTAEYISKWINKKTDLLKIYYKIEQQKNNRFKELYEYYKIDYELELKRPEIIDMIDSHDDYFELKTTLQLINNVLKLIDSAIDVLKLKHFELKNYIDYLKFINGE